MKCPVCEANIELTWKRYWRAPFGGHGCDNCEAKFRIKQPLNYYIILVFIWLLAGGIPAFVAVKLGLSPFFAILVYLLCGLVIIIPIDKKLDERCTNLILKEKS